jgi:ribosomal protein L32
MAATPKHRRSSSKRRSTKASNRYDVTLTKFRKMKKKGGKVVHLSSETGKMVPSHMVTKDNPTYKGIKVITKK